MEINHSGNSTNTNDCEDLIPSTSSINDSASLILHVLKQILINLQQSTSNQSEPLDLSNKPVIIDYSSSASSSVSGYINESTTAKNTTSNSDKTHLPKKLWKPKSFDFDHFFTKQVKRFTANDVCFSRCRMLYKDHYHCYADNGECKAVMKGKEQLRQHGKVHSVAKELTVAAWMRCSNYDCQLYNEVHYHCNHKDCSHISVGDEAHMSRLAHVENTHYQVILKRTHNYRYTPYQPSGITKLASKNIKLSEQKSDMNSHCVSFDNFNDSTLTNDVNSFIQEKSTNDEQSLLKINESYSNISESSNQYKYNTNQCVRLFCNLKKTEHFHCPQCDVGCSKLELFIRHCRRHK